VKEVFRVPSAGVVDSRSAIPVRIKDGVLFPVLGIALVRCEQSAYVVNVDAVRLEDITQSLDQLVQTADH